MKLFIEYVSLIIRSYLRRYSQDALESYHIICTSKLETGQDIKPHSALHKTRKYRLGIFKPGKIVVGIMDQFRHFV